MLVSSSGGVLLDLLALEPWWSSYEVRWAAVAAADTRSALHGQAVDWIAERRASRPLGVLAGIADAWRVMRAFRPDVIVSAGTGVAVGFFVVARATGVPTLWVSTLNVVAAPGVAARICGRLASVVLHQQEQLLAVQPGLLIGELY